MNANGFSAGKSRLNILLFLSLVLIVFSYSNSLNAGWHFDDISNILQNEKVHLTEISIDEIIDTFSANSSKIGSNNLYRPLPMFTFALNWYFSQDNVYSYHVVNILIHVLTAYALFCVIRLLFQFQQYCQNDAEEYSPSFIDTTALLTALLWALAPIQTQAVTYIVQRMAAMAAMFTIFAIYAYLRARAEKTKKKYCWFLTCFIFYFAALGSKSNSILLPASLLLLEISFLNSIKTKIFFRIVALSAAILIVAFLFIYYGLGLNPLDMEAYAHRPFTLTQRVLTEPRIIVMYLSQIALPIADRLSLEHDIVLSTSLLFPWTTLPAILFIFAAVFFSAKFLKEYPFFAFPILFYFLNHIVESTFIPLELAFEHRNYLPSLFFFLPIGYLFAQALYGQKKFSAIGRIAVMFCGAFYLTVSSHATYTRNQAWATEGSLWQDALKKAPFSSRAALQLGIWYSRNGSYDEAYYYFRHALEHVKTSQVPKYTECLVLNSLTLNRIVFARYDEAHQYADRCLEIESSNIDCQERKVDIYLRQGVYQDAFSHAKVLADAVSDGKLQIKAAIAAYHAKDIEASLFYLKKVVHSSLDHHQIMYLTGLVLMKMEAFPNSLLFLKRANNLSPNVIKYNLTLAAAYHANGEALSAEEMIQKLFKEQSLSAITDVLKSMKQYDLDKKSVEFIENKIAIVFRNLIHEKQDS